MITAIYSRPACGMSFTCPCASARATAKQNAVALVAKASPLWCGVGYMPLPCLWPAKETPAAAGFGLSCVAVLCVARGAGPQAGKLAPHAKGRAQRGLTCS
jgi:hypothetical protein